ncbi:uncharacterized protein LOC102808508 [Saccoglossus kowalevskii]|uniref:Uncharacterized protein LOC102808508 n=1 Tax=Saccoglossus kowalevskii TaxID=10224 RepID=A0ABM0LVJ6_SACKO|nr:PREDICTED: uncharacterized protein LOC102808508 [Saccoglossus kowalevskii]
MSQKNPRSYCGVAEIGYQSVASYSYIRSCDLQARVSDDVKLRANTMDGIAVTPSTVNYADKFVEFVERLFTSVFYLFAVYVFICRVRGDYVPFIYAVGTSGQHSVVSTGDLIFMTPIGQHSHLDIGDIVTVKDTRKYYDYYIQKVTDIYQPSVTDIDPMVEIQYQREDSIQLERRWFKLSDIVGRHYFSVSFPTQMLDETKDAVCKVADARRHTIHEWVSIIGNAMYFQFLHNSTFCSSSYYTKAIEQQWIKNVGMIRHVEIPMPCWYKQRVVIEDILSEDEMNRHLHVIIANLENWFSVIGLSEKYDLTLQMLEAAYVGHTTRYALRIKII